MPDNPDIRVRLSPEGQAEVIAALRQIQREARGASGSAAKDVGLIDQALTKLKGLIPTIGFGALAAGIFLVGKNALATADHLAKLQQRGLGTVEDLSALSFGALLADVDQGGLEKGLGRLTRSIGELQRGTSDQAESFAELGLTARDFIGKDAVHAFELVAQRIAAVTDPYRRLQLVNDLFGTGMAKLIPLINAVGTQGFGALRAEAERLGLVFTTDLAKAAEEVNDHLKIIGKRSEALAIQFLTGFAPAFSETMKLFEDETTNKGTNAIKEFGEAVAAVVDFTVKAYLIAGATIGAVLAIIEDKAQNLRKLTLRLLQAGASSGTGIIGILRELTRPDEGSNRQAEIMDQLGEKIARIRRGTGLATEELKKFRDASKGGQGADDDGGLASFNVRERLAALTKRLNLEQLKDFEEIVKHREKLNAALILAERGVADARAAVNAQTIEGQRKIEAAEAELLRQKARTVEESSRIEIEASKAKEALLTAAVRRQFGDGVTAQKLLAEITRQSSREQLDTETKRFTALVALQDDYLKRYRESRQQIVALDKEIADNRKQQHAFADAITLEGLSEEQKKNFVFKQGQQKNDELRTAALKGDLEKMRELRREAFSIAEDLKRLGDPGSAERIVNEAASLFETGALARKLAARQAGDEAKKAADDIGKQLETIKGQIDQFAANLIFDLKPVLSTTAMADLVKQIQAELGKEPFQIALRAKLISEIDRGTVIGQPGFAEGGMIPGVSPYFTADDKLLWGTSGEYIMQVPAVRHYGADFMRMVNQMQLPKFAEGGMVGGDGGGGGGALQPVNVHLGGRSVRAYTATDDLDRFIDLLKEARRGSS